MSQVCEDCGRRVVSPTVTVNPSVAAVRRDHDTTIVRLARLAQLGPGWHDPAMCPVCVLLGEVDRLAGENEQLHGRLHVDATGGTTAIEIGLPASGVQKMPDPYVEAARLRAERTAS